MGSRGSFESLIMASNSLTVIGMPVLFFEILWFFEFILSETYMSYKIWPTYSESLGKYFILAYVRYFSIISILILELESSLALAYVCRVSSWEAISLSAYSSLMSFTMMMQSNLYKIELWKSIYLATCFKPSYLPKMGLAAARTEAQEGSFAQTSLYIMTYFFFLLILTYFLKN